jgi:hypothetical protein
VRGLALPAAERGSAEPGGDHDHLDLSLISTGKPRKLHREHGGNQ